MITFEELAAFARTLPQTQEGTSYGTPALKVQGKLLVRLRENGETIVVQTTFDEPAALIDADSDTYSALPHDAAFRWWLSSSTGRTHRRCASW